MMSNDEQQVIALAATVQALTTVHEIATTGQFDKNRAAPLLKALINYSPDDTLAAYGGDIDGLRYGCGQLKKLFSDSLDRDIAQYLLAIVTIELKLVRNPSMRSILQNRLQEVSQQLDNTEHKDHNTDFSFDEDEDKSEKANADALVEKNTHKKFNNLIEQLSSVDTISHFADIYKQTASQTEPRVMIKGNHQYLQQEDSANQIRALLLAALRGAAFFRHYGGKRIDFMMKRKHYLSIAQKLS